MPSKPIPTPKEYTKEEVYKYFVSTKEKRESVKVLIYEDYPEALTEATAALLFAKYPDVKEIHELNHQWGGRWSKKTVTQATLKRGSMPAQKQH